jgi:LCP family protein required for cell wall assembly
MNGRSEEKTSGAKTKAGKIILGVISALLFLVIVVAAIMVGFYKSGESSLKSSAASNAPIIESDASKEFAGLKTIAWQDGWVAYNGGVYEYNEEMLNFLLMGIDTNGSISDVEDLTNYKAGQADAIFIASLNQRDKTISVIAVPRNSIVELKVYDENKEIVRTFHNQICLQYGYAGGGDFGLLKMKESVSELLYELPIHGACAISLDAISVIVDMLGGVKVTVPNDLTNIDPSFVEGAEVTITKKTAVQYLRYRDISVLGSPTTRLTRQKGFIKAALGVAIDAIKKNPMIATEMYKAVLPYMNTDITLDKAVYLASQMIGYSFGDSSFYQITGVDNAVEREDGSSFYDDYYLDEDSLKEIVFEVFYDKVVLEDK